MEKNPPGDESSSLLGGGSSTSNLAVPVGTTGGAHLPLRMPVCIANFVIAKNYRPRNFKNKSKLHTYKQQNQSEQNRLPAHFQERAEVQMLVVAAAVGVASCFGAPISGEEAPQALGVNNLLFPFCVLLFTRRSRTHPSVRPHASAAHLLSPPSAFLHLPLQSVLSPCSMCFLF